MVSNNFRHFWKFSGFGQMLNIGPRTYCRNTVEPFGNLWNLSGEAGRPTCREPVDPFWEAFPGTLLCSLFFLCFSFV